MTDRYASGVGRVLGRPRLWVAAFVLIVAVAVMLWRRVPTAFIPTEDKGYFAIAMQLPDAASLQRTEAVIQRVEGFLREEPAVVNIVAFAGLDLLTRTNQTNSATIFILLKPWDERGKDETHRRHHQADQRQAVRDEGRGRVRVQPAGDPGPGRHRRASRSTCRTAPARTSATSRCRCRRSRRR